VPRSFLSYRENDHAEAPEFLGRDRIRQGKRQRVGVGSGAHMLVKACSTLLLKSMNIAGQPASHDGHNFAALRKFSRC
jgi:hypothetical protein